MNDIETRMQRLEDLEAIRTLTATYANMVDKGVNGKQVDFEKLPSVFAEKAHWAFAAGSVAVTGRDEIVKMLRGSTSPYSFAMHSFTNPIIAIDGDTASATWLLWVAITTMPLT